MAFTNLWDQTFPPDTQLASQGGADLRQLRVDTQQRMAAISGLDASKPAFGSDAQPAAWNGILFFATDTGFIYQWNNPAWTNVTSSIVHSGALYRTTVQVINTGNTVENTIYTSPALPALALSQYYRVMLFVSNNGQNTTTPTSIRLKINGGALDVPQFINSAGFNSTGNYSLEYYLGARTGATTTLTRRVSQSENDIAAGHAQQGMISTEGAAIGFDMTAGTNTFTITSKSGANSDQQTFNGITIETV